MYLIPEPIKTEKSGLARHALDRRPDGFFASTPVVVTVDKLLGKPFNCGLMVIIIMMMAIITP